MFGADANDVGGGRHGDLRNEAGREEIDLWRAKPARHVTAVGILVDLPRRAELKEFAIFDHADPGSHGHGLDLIVGDIKYRCAELDLNAFELEPQFGAQFCVERRQRLVHQIDRGIAHQRAADGNPLHFATREPRGLVAELSGNVKKLGGLFDPLADRRFRHAARGRPQRESEIVINRQMRIKRVLLKHERDVARPGWILRHVAAVD